MAQTLETLIEKETRRYKQSSTPPSRTSRDRRTAPRPRPPPGSRSELQSHPGREVLPGPPAKPHSARLTGTALPEAQAGRLQKQDPSPSSHGSLKALTAEAIKL